MQIYNTLINQKEEFKPIHPGKVMMYVCGPTVYNYIHIGNARSVVAFDTVRRYLEYKGFDVQYVSNFTDVDDKLIKASQETGMTVPELADKYIKAFYEDIDALNVKRATLNPRVMENMDEIIAFINELVKKGAAYAVDGDVYFKTREFKTYGRLSGQSINDLEQGASERVTDEEQAKKRDPLDFALWKKAKPGEIAWDSPWGKGRPGWHIECSVMATKYLEDTIDIHAGGADLEFPHHENEIAQSESKTGHKFVNYWMHNGFVTIGKENEKMSKSLGNFVTVHDLVKKVDPQVIRFFMATTHYRRPVQYTEENLAEAKTNLEKLTTAYRNLDYRMKDASEISVDEAVQQQFEQLVNDYEKAMDDDFNVQNAMTSLYEFAKLMNVYAEKEQVSKDLAKAMLAKFEALTQIIGIKMPKQELLDEEIEKLIQERTEARANKDYARSDEIRDELKCQGIILEDTAQGTRWRRE
ncbi:cysteine--tRNA ligase [Ligilactobacillus aviarius]|uniref:cysteine--tRNA ligase n=1 Tax=Ligilactobacillus aviarius TaxID=1606 RepID=UPI0024BA630D|nr:cysteine--tRNA ligase [Ligilactobacillus aviarius]